MKRVTLIAGICLATVSVATICCLALLGGRKHPGVHGRWLPTGDWSDTGTYLDFSADSRCEFVISSQIEAMVDSRSKAGSLLAAPAGVYQYTYAVEHISLPPKNSAFDIRGSLDQYTTDLDLIRVTLKPVSNAPAHLTSLGLVSQSRKATIDSSGRIIGPDDLLMCEGFLSSGEPSGTDVLFRRSE